MAANLNLYGFKLAQVTSFESKNCFELSTPENKVSWANLTIYKIILHAVS